MPDEKILLAVADPLKRQQCAACLKVQGYGLVAAADGPQALKAAAAEEVALAVLDLDLPGCSGMEVLSRLQAASPDAEAILLTGAGSPEDAGQTVSRRAYACLRREGLDPETLAAVVARALERQRLTRENRLLQEGLRQAREELARHGELLEEARSQAVLDGLTGLYNYRHFWDLLYREVEISRRYGCPLSLLFLDVDRFKEVNDALGHAQGDAVLKELASFLKNSVRRADLVCRYGGEEFVVILPRTPAVQALNLAERLCGGIQALQLYLQNRPVQLSVSIGVAGLEPGKDAETLLNEADAALYRAKVAGRNRVCGPD